MIKKLIYVLSLCLILFPAVAEDDAQPRVSIFSTSNDWQAITGLYLNQYKIDIIPDDKLIGEGLQLYYLDEFPCYGQGGRTSYWVGKFGKHSDWPMLLACVYPPTSIKLAYLNAARDAVQSKTTGMLECPVEGERELTLDLSKCVIDKDWKDIR